MADHLGGQGLHHLDGVGAHAVAVVEVLGHTKDHHIVLFLRPGHIGPLVGHLPAEGHHIPGVAGEDGDLPGEGVQNRVAAEEGVPHFFLHPHADLVELGAHQVLAGHGGEVGPVHHLRHMVAGDGPPVGDPGGAVLIAAGVPPIGVALSVADQDRDVTLEDIPVHQHRVPPPGGPQVHHVVGVLAVVGGDLAGVIELVEQLLPQNLFHLTHGGPGVQAVGKQQENILFLHPGRVELIQAGPDGHPAVGGGLTAPLDNVGDDKDHRLSRSGQLPERRHPDGIADALQGGGVEAVPVLGQAGRVGHRLTGDKDVGAVGQLGGHQAVSVFKIQLHKLLPQIQANNFQILLRVEPDLPLETGEGDKAAVDLVDGGQHGGVVRLQAAAVNGRFW